MPSTSTPSSGSTASPPIPTSTCPRQHATAKLLATAIGWAVPRAEWRCPDPHVEDAEAVARWCGQLDIRRVELSGGDLEVGAVAGYLAKYVTKSVLDSGALDRRIPTVDQLQEVLPRLRAHPARLVLACWRLGRRPDCDGLRRWAHSYGYGGHWLTKSRLYSTTFGERRNVRRTWRRHHDLPDRSSLGLDAQLLDDEEPILIGAWGYRGVGYRSSGDRELAVQAADQARSRREQARAARRAVREASTRTVPA